MFARSLVTGLVSLIALMPVIANAAVKFKINPIPMSATVGKAFDVDLKTLLDPAVTPSGPLKWSATNKPAWLTIDSNNSRVFGTPAPADAGQKTFKLNVGDADSGAIADVQMTVVIPIEPPKWSTQDIDLGIQNEDKPWTFDLKNFVTNDPNGGPLSFDAAGLPNWIKLDKTTGILSGTPKRIDVGAYSGIVFTATNKGGSSTTKAHGLVLKTIKPPKWTQNPIALPDAFEDQAYTQELIGFVSNPEGTPLTFKIVNHTPPPWLSMGQTSATLFGTPKVPGNVEVTVMLSTTIDGTPFEHSTTAKLKVIHVNHAPKWAADPIKLPNGASNVPYSQDVSKSASDPDNDKPLTFKIESGPAWLKINGQTGIFSGTPAKTDVGTNSWVVSVTDPGGLSARTTFIVEIIKSNEPPVWLAHPTILPDATEDKPYELDLAKYAKDPDNDPMTFTKIDGPAWASISGSGKLLGTPGKNDIGLTTFSVKVSDNISGSDITDLKIIVIHTNHPPIWILDPINLQAKEDAPFTTSISQYAQDPDDDKPLVFSAIQGPTWAQLSSNGTFTGTPKATDVGVSKYTVRVADPSGLTADVTVFITVDHVNHKPYWTADPVVLPNGKQETAYTANVAAFAKDPDNDPLRFTKVGGAPWVQVDTSGNVTGTPVTPGDYVFQVRVMDPANEFAVTNVKITVEKVNHAPRWRQNPIQMADGYEDTTYSFNLSIYAVDDDGDPLKFKLLSGPAWMFVGQDGKITGTPTKDDIGNFTAKFQVSDGQLTADADGVGVVIHKNHPPTIDANLPVFTIKEREPFTKSLLEFIKDSDGDKLNCVLISLTDWVKIAPDCTLTANPLHKHIGDHSFDFKVDDGQTAINGIVKIKVIRNPRPPIWLEDPIRFEAKTNENFVADLSTKAQDLDGLKVTFTKVVQGQEGWLTVGADGKLSGKPTDAELGENKLRVKVCNTDPSCAEADLIITVKPGTQIDTVQVDSAVPGAPAEHLWVVDNSSQCNTTISSLRSNIRYFFDDLNKAQLHHTGVLISADAHAFDGWPIPKNGSLPPLMPWTASNIASDFVRRVDLAYSGGHCGNCYNSPIWSMQRFYTQAPSMSFHHNGYFDLNVPMDTMMVTHQRDHFKYYTKNTTMKDWTASDFTKSFVDFHAKDNKAYRVSAIAPECPTLLEMSGDASSAAPSNAYRVVVDKTGGRYYATTCDFNMKATLSDYAKRIIFRAYVHAKNRIKLSKVPMSVNTIKVSVGALVLTPDQFLYDAQKNEVQIFWNKIDESSLKPGDLIRIEYRIS